MRRAQGDAWRRLRQTRCIPRLCHPGGAHSKTDAGHAYKAVVVARRRHDARPLSSRHSGKMIGALDTAGNLTGLRMRISGQSILTAVRPEALENGKDTATFQGLNAGGAEAAIGYSIPNVLIDHAMRNPHVPPGFWRGVNINQNAIYLECFMDELAHAAGQDPLEFRRKLMSKHPKHLGVLNTVAEKIGWSKPATQGVVRGIAQHLG